jgi:acetyl esterase/lipase
MPQKRRFQQPNKRQQASRPPSDTRRSSLASIIPSEPVAPTVYGKAFIVAEDAQKNTFYFHGGAWVAYPESIAQIKLTSGQGIAAKAEQHDPLRGSCTRVIAS